MNKFYSLSLFLIISFFMCLGNANADIIKSIFPENDKKEKVSGTTEITANTMDADMKNNIVTLTGNVVVNEPENKIMADKITLFLEKKGERREVKNIVATGHVVIIRKALTKEEKERGERKATAGRADYNLKTGVVVLTDNPVIYQGGSFVKGSKITLWRDSERLKIEGNEGTGQMSKVFYTDTNISFPGVD